MTCLSGREIGQKCIVRDPVSFYLHSPVHGEEIQSVQERNKDEFRRESQKEQVTERFTDTH